MCIFTMNYFPLEACYYQSSYFLVQGKPQKCPRLARIPIFWYFPLPFSSKTHSFLVDGHLFCLCYQWQFKQNHLKTQANMICKWTKTTKDRFYFFRNTDREYLVLMWMVFGRIESEDFYQHVGLIQWTFLALLAWELRVDCGASKLIMFSSLSIFLFVRGQ